MSDFSDIPTEEGVRRQTAYRSREKKKLMLEMPRKGGGTIDFLIAENMQSNDQRTKLNILQAVVPFTRLPQHDLEKETPQGSIPRQGWIYVFRMGKLWRELESDGKGGLSDVDIPYWRKQWQARAGDTTPDIDEPQRIAEGETRSVILIPSIINGKGVSHLYLMAYSEKPWSRGYIAWLEEDPERISARCTHLGPIWSAANTPPDIWRASQNMPISRIDQLDRKIRPRDFALESMFANPADLQADTNALPEDEIFNRKLDLQRELASKLGEPQPEPLPAIEPTEDALQEVKDSSSKIRPAVVIILDDPLYCLRHAMGQLELAEQYLIALNAILPHRENGRYAQVLNDLVIHNNLIQYVDKQALYETVFRDERRAVRDHMEALLEHILRLFAGKLPVVIRDWLHTADERQLEPYMLMAGAIRALAKDPATSDVLHNGERNPRLRRQCDRLIEQLIKEDHPFSRSMLGRDPDSEQLASLQALAEQEREPDPSRMGMEMLMYAASHMQDEEVDNILLIKNLQALVGDSVNYLAVDIMRQMTRLSESNVLTAEERDSLLTRLARFFQKLSPAWQQISAKSRAMIDKTREAIVGVDGPELENGLSRGELQELQRNYMYARLRKSVKLPQAEKTFTLRSGSMLITAKFEEPIHQSVLQLKRGQFNGNLSLPSLAFVVSLYNLHVQTVDMASLYREGKIARYLVGSFSALTDLTAASASLARPLLGHNQLTYWLGHPRFNVEKISKKWAENLIKQTRNPKLALIRGLSGLAIIFTAVVNMWDASIFWKRNDHIGSLVQFITATGAISWGLYSLGICINPAMLIIGATLFIGGTLASLRLSDTKLEGLLKHGPFGSQHGKEGWLIGDNYKQLNDPNIAYMQLLGILAEPSLQVFRYADWLEEQKDPSPQKELVVFEQRRRTARYSRVRVTPPQRTPFDEDDWVIILSSPLLPMFETPELDYQIKTLDYWELLKKSGMINAAKTGYANKPGDKKLDALPIADDSVLFVVSHVLPKIPLEPQYRYAYQLWYNLKVFIQFSAGSVAAKQPLIIPQPHPRHWIPFSPQHRHEPDGYDNSDSRPYWHIESFRFDS